jgi:N6-adenosine-specific RNA methylase IME4
VALGAKQQALPDKKYGVILMDPEWRFEPYSRETGLDRAADNHYPTSDQRMLLMREIGKISAKDCMCAMWVTDLTNGVRLMESYGFQVKSRIIWVKDIVEGPRNEAGQRTYVQVGPAGTGYWARDRAEILLIGTRGDFPAPAPGTQGESVWFAARGRHSEKPEEAYLWIEKHWPNLPKIELNARAARPGWDRWGNEAPVEQDGGREIGAALSVAPPAVHNGQGATMAEQSAEPAAVSHGGSRTPGETDCVTAGETAPVSESAAAIAASLGSGPRWQNQISKTADLDLDRDLPSFLRRRPVSP